MIMIFLLGGGGYMEFRVGVFGNSSDNGNKGGCVATQIFYCFLITTGGHICVRVYVELYQKGIDFFVQGFDVFARDIIRCGWCERNIKNNWFSVIVFCKARMLTLHSLELQFYSNCNVIMYILVFSCAAVFSHMKCYQTKPQRLYPSWILSLLLSSHVSYSNEGRLCLTIYDI